MAVEVDPVEGKIPEMNMMPPDPMQSNNPDTLWINEPRGALERLLATVLIGLLRACFRPWIGPPFTVTAQRRVVALIAVFLPGRSGTSISPRKVLNTRVYVMSPRSRSARGAILYLHGGAYCLGGHYTHRSITTRLAVLSGLQVWVPEYRLAPEHPYPAALDDAFACYEAMIADGFGAREIAIAGDSAGGALALDLALKIRSQHASACAALALISPVTDPHLRGDSMHSKAAVDPMIRRGWLEQGIGWYSPPTTPGSALLDTNLAGLPPMMIQVGDREVLLSDSLALAARARDHGVASTLQVYRGRWHVFHLQAFYLSSAVSALTALANFIRIRIAPGA